MKWLQFIWLLIFTCVPVIGFWLMLVNERNMKEKLELQKRVEELVTENKCLKNGLVSIHNLLLDFYSEPDTYWDNPNLAFKKVNEVLDELTKIRGKKALGEEVK